MRAFLACIALFAAAPVLSGPQQSPEDVARSFFKWDLSNWGSGLPEAAELKPVRYLLSPGLYSVLLRAKSQERVCSEKTHAEELRRNLILKPPIVEGDIFSGSVEGATGVVSVHREWMGAYPRVRVTLEYIDKYQAPHSKYWRSEWNVFLDFARAEDRWVIADFHGNAGEDAGADDHSLMRGMRRYAAEACHW